MSLDQSLLFIIGILITSGLFYLILFFGFRQKTALLFITLFCFCQAAKAFFRTDGALAMDLFGVTELQSRLVTGIVYSLGSFFLLSFIALHLGLERKSRLVLAIAVMVLAFYFFRWPQMPLVISMGIIMAVSVFRRQKVGSSLIILGLLFFGATTYIEIRHINLVGYFIGIIAFIATITIFIGYQIREQIRLQRKALLRSSTLENQLLKRSLQPHFLFNSLMSLQEWIETRPDRAAQFVQALAEEFRSICQMSGQPLIPIEEELSMCRSHLEIMGFRKHACFQLETEGITGDEQVPPAIFHTLIENGLTHGYANRESGYFKLTRSTAQQTCTYQLFNDGNNHPHSSNGANGTGMKYVQSRLEESYPGRWQLSSQPVEGGWMVTIQVRSVP
jgi:hypothetical protein